jgi:hypothetical protein
MAENETLPTSGKSADWLKYADQKEQAFKDYHSETNIFGQIKNPAPLQDDYSKLLSDHALQARKMGMDLLRKETAAQGKAAAGTPSYRKGGRVKTTGPAKLHKGEAVISDRKKARKKSRSKSRSTSR